MMPRAGSAAIRQQIQSAAAATSKESNAAADEQNSSGKSPQAEQNPGQGGAPQPPPLSSTERDTLAVQWQQRLAGAAQQAMQAGKLGGALARLVDHLLQPQLPWRMLLARYLTSIARDDYSYMRPSRREGNAILPSLRSHHLELTVVLDTSGSVTESRAQRVSGRGECHQGPDAGAHHAAHLRHRTGRGRPLAGRGLGRDSNCHAHFRAVVAPAFCRRLPGPSARTASLTCWCILPMPRVSFRRTNRRSRCCGW